MKRLIRDFGDDLILNAGGGIHGHPNGPAQGGKAFLEAIEAVQSGVELIAYAQDHDALRGAIATWGVKE